MKATQTKKNIIKQTNLIVQKYGGTSVGSPERIQIVADRIIKNLKTTKKLIVVVSAMGKTTDELVNLSKQVSDNPDHREMDALISNGENISAALLAMSLIHKKVNAIYIVAKINLITIGTARYRPTDFGMKLERFAVLKEYRKFGVGSAMVLYILKKLENQKSIYLNSQKDVVNFYKKLGFEIIGEAFYEAEIAHYKMKLV